MTPHFLVCPFEPTLIRRLAGRSVAPRIDRIEDLPGAVNAVAENGAHLHCLIVHTELPVADIPFHEDWKSLPLAVFAPRAGRIAGLVRQLGLMRQLNLRVYLSTANEENYTGVRILSSLGVETALVLEPGHVDWESVTDLMTYAFYARAPHAPIAPFEYLQQRYQAQARNDFGAVYFDDPRTYLHLDRQGRVALSHADLVAGKTVADDLDGLDDVAGTRAYKERLYGWTRFFLEPTACASCAGWRVCLGRLADTRAETPGCETFCTEFMDALDDVQRTRQRGLETWQP